MMEASMSTKELRTLIYTNVVLADMMDNPVMDEFITKAVGDDWESFSVSTSDVPDAVSKQKYVPHSFMSGMAYDQWKRTQRGGTFINAMLIGISAIENDVWEKTIRDASVDFNQSVMFLDVPYGVYTEACALSGTEPLPQEEYDILTDDSKLLISGLTSPSLQHIN